MNKRPRNTRPASRRVRSTIAALSLAGLIAASAALADDILTPNGDTTWGAPDLTDTVTPFKDTTWG